MIMTPVKIRLKNKKNFIMMAPVPEKILNSPNCNELMQEDLFRKNPEITEKVESIERVFSLLIAPVFLN